MSVRLADVDIVGLRCLDGMNLDFGPLSALIGANGAGKSSTVRALEFLFGQTDLGDEDVTDGLDENTIIVRGRFVDLPDAWTAALDPWLGDDGSLTIERRRMVDGGSIATPWLTERVAVAEFAPIRAAIGDGSAVMTIIKPMYATLRETFPDLPGWSSKANAAAALDSYEADHPEVPRRRVQDATLSFRGGGPYDLTAMIELLLLPAMRDAAADASERRGNTLGRLVELTVRSQLDVKNELAELSVRTAVEYEQILAAHSGNSLDKLSGIITDQLASFAPGASVRLSWEHQLMPLTAPPVRARLVESGHEDEIGRQGHGVQRAYVFSLLRALLQTTRAQSDAEPAGLLLLVEEPEVYQHPVRARYVAKVLADLAYSTDQSTQVVYTTHSPYFVSVSDVPSVRLLKLCSAPGDAAHTNGEQQHAVRHTRSFSFNPVAAAERLNAAFDGHGRVWTPERVTAQLPGLLDSSVAEALFADAALLVEGGEDVGMIDGAAEAVGIDLAGEGIACAAVAGKGQLPLAWVMLEAFGIPTYLVFDTDDRGNRDFGALLLNQVLTMLAGDTGMKKPGHRVESRWASAHPTLKEAVDSEIGAATVNEVYVRTADAMGLPAATTKNGYHARTAVAALYGNGHTSGTLDAIVAAVVSLKSASATPISQ